jgi:hypothetical protein
VTAAGESYCWGQKIGSKLGDAPAVAQTLEPTRAGQITFRTGTD